MLTTLSIALERFIAIKYPLHVFEGSLHLIVFCGSFSAIYNIPRFFEFETIYSDHSHSLLNVSDYEYQVGSKLVTK